MALVTLAALVCGVLSAWPGTATSAAASTGPCGQLAYVPNSPPSYAHVVLIMDENLSFKAYTESAQASYLHGLAAACGTETNMHNATHSSQPNYMATSSGIPSGNVHVANDNLFHQADVAGDSWRVYAEGMPASCSAMKSAAPLYKTGHNAAFWYADLSGSTGSCMFDDVPSVPALSDAIDSDALPTFSWIVPNVCNDMHAATDCPSPTSQRVAQGDAWLSSLVHQLTATPSYQSGRTLIVITWDEGSGKSTVGVDCTDPGYYPTHPDCHIPTIVVSPYIQAGSTDSSDHNLYGLLGTVEDLLGYPRLNRAVGQTSLRKGLGF